jgi:hypothetical protein
MSQSIDGSGTGVDGGHAGAPGIPQEPPGKSEEAKAEFWSPIRKMHSDVYNLFIVNPLYCIDKSNPEGIWIAARTLKVKNCLLSSLITAKAFTNNEANCFK